MKPEELDDRVKELANFRRQLGEVRAQETIREMVYLGTQEYADFEFAQAARRKLEERVMDAEARVRSLGIDLYAETGEKKFPGVTVKVYETMKYDMALAKAYCMERYPEALSVIKKDFEKLAGVTKPKFVKFEEEPRVAIDSDLSKFLEES